MKISEFLRGRNVERQAVSRYINRHQEIFDGHIKKVGKELELDSFAVNELEQKYPLPAPVHLIDGIPHEMYIQVQNELIESQKKVENLQSLLMDAQGQIAMAQSKEILLEDKINQVEELKNEIEDLKEQLSDEKSKGFFAKLFGR